MDVLLFLLFCDGHCGDDGVYARWKNDFVPEFDCVCSRPRYIKSVDDSLIDFSCCVRASWSECVGFIHLEIIVHPNLILAHNSVAASNFQTQCEKAAVKNSRQP